MQFVDEGDQWRLGDALYDGFSAFERRAWVNVGGVRAGRELRIRGAALGGKWGIVDGEGRVLVAPRYDGMFAFSEERTWGNLGGEMKATYGWSAYWCEGGAWALLDGEDGRELVPPTFTTVRDFSGGVAWAKANEQWGLIDRQGAWLIEPRFDEINWRSRERPSFVEGVEPVAVGGRWGLIDRRGQWVLEPTWDNIADFMNGRARVSTWIEDPNWDPDDMVGRPAKWGYIDARGRLIDEE